MCARAFGLTALLLALALPPAHAAPSQIVGGQPATQPYRHQALLEVDLPGGRRARCGGTLIAARYVLTAAHCIDVEGQKAVAVTVSLGQSDVTAPARNFSGVAWEVHPEFAPGDWSGTGGGHDVAVVRLNKVAEFEQARLLRPADTGLWAAGVTATVIGWGLTEDEAQGGVPSNQLREVAIPVYADEACAADFQAADAPAGFFEPVTMLCAGGKDGRDACGGDSGGPLLVPDGKRFALAGIVSFGAVFIGPDGREYSCAENVPGVYARVGAEPLNGWVRSHVPQVEINAAPAQPQPGQRVSLTAAGANYDRYEWDLDADGAFDDGTGPSAAITASRGPSTLAVRATRGFGDLRDEEVRRIDVVGQYRSPVGFSDAALTVKEGRSVEVTVTKAGAGAGGVTVTPSPGSALMNGIDVQEGVTPLRLDFAGDRMTRSFTLHTLDDRSVEGPETFTLDLGGHTGELVPGGAPRLTVTIADDDVRPRITGLSRSAGRRRGRVKLRYRITTAATVAVSITDRRGRVVLAAARRRHARPGTYSATLELRRAATRLLRSKRSVRARAVYAMFDGDARLDSRILNFTLRR